MTIDEISAWIDAHQLIVISILIPCFSTLIAAFASWYATHRALKTERSKMNFEATLKIAEFRQAWINSLRDEMSEFQSYGVLPGHDPSTINGVRDNFQARSRVSDSFDFSPFAF